MRRASRRMPARCSMARRRARAGRRGARRRPRRGRGRSGSGGWACPAPRPPRPSPPARPGGRAPRRRRGRGPGAARACQARRCAQRGRAPACACALKSAAKTGCARAQELTQARPRWRCRGRGLPSPAGTGGIRALLDQHTHKALHLLLDPRSHVAAVRAIAIHVATYQPHALRAFGHVLLEAAQLLQMSLGFLWIANQVCVTYGDLQGGKVSLLQEENSSRSSSVFCWFNLFPNFTSIKRRNPCRNGPTDHSVVSLRVLFPLFLAQPLHDPDITTLNQSVCPCWQAPKIVTTLFACSLLEHHLLQAYYICLNIEKLLRDFCLAVFITNVFVATVRKRIPRLFRDSNITVCQYIVCSN